MLLCLLRLLHFQTLAGPKSLETLQKFGQDASRPVGRSGGLGWSLRTGVGSPVFSLPWVFAPPPPGGCF